jgi:hypothetical protein
MRVAVLQPSYLPWLGYLDQIARADAFVFYDDVQYDKHGWRNRNRIRVPGVRGWAWLTVPVRLERSFPSLLEVRADPRVPWRRKHRATLQTSYARAPHLDLLDRYFAALFEGAEESLVEIAIRSVEAFMGLLGIPTPLYRSSALGVGGDRNERLLNICRYFGASQYLSGAAARAYLDVELFARNGVAVEWQDYVHPIYRQPYEPFVSHLSALDAVLCVGRAAREFLGSARGESLARLPEPALP